SRQVQLVPFEHDTLQAEDDRAVRVALLIRIDVMPAVNRDPLLGDHSRAEPQPEAEYVPQYRMQSEAAMRLVPVEIKRNAQEHHLDHHEGHYHVAPEGQLKKTVGRRSHHGARKIT